MSIEVTEYVGQEAPSKKSRKVVTVEDAQKALAKAGIDDLITIQRQMARGEFGNWQAENALGPILITSNFHYMAQVERVCKLGALMMDDKMMPPEIKVKAGLMVITGAKAARDIAQDLWKLAKECGVDEAKPAPKFAPPNLEITASGDVHIHEQPKVG